MDRFVNWHKEHKRHASAGDKAADNLRNGMGSWRFVFFFILFMLVWAWINTHAGWHHWDAYPFILLNLFLSMLAGLQGAILLIAARRADSLSAAMAEHDYRTNVAAAKDIERLMAINEEQLQLIKELSEQLNKTRRK